MSGFPQHVKINIRIDMHQMISHVNHVSPRDMGMLRSKLGCYAVGRFANILNQLGQARLQHDIRLDGFSVSRINKSFCDSRGM